MTRLSQVSIAWFTLASFTADVFVMGHTWGDQLRRISSNGTMIGDPGYPRGYMARGDAGFAEQSVLYQLPRPSTQSTVIPNDALFTEFTSTDYATQYPRLSASPGEWVSIRYQENGHVSLPQNQANKPLNRGTISVWFTTGAGTDTPNFWDVYNWTSDGTGGNGKGRLIATRNYDDGRCHQTNNGAISTERAAKFPKDSDSLQGTDLWCQTDVKIPSDVTASSGTLLWAWNWPTLDPSVFDINDTTNGIFPIQGNGVTIPEVYTIVADVDLSTSGSTDSMSTSSESTGEVINFVASNLQPANIGNAAISDQLSNSFQVDVSGSGSGSGTGASSSSSSTPATTPVATAAPSATTSASRKVVTVTAAPVHTTMTVYSAQHTSASATTRSGSPHKRRNVASL